MNRTSSSSDSSEITVSHRQVYHGDLNGRGVHHQPAPVEPPGFWKTYFGWIGTFFSALAWLLCCGCCRTEVDDTPPIIRRNSAPGPVKYASLEVVREKRAASPPFEIESFVSLDFQEIKEALGIPQIKGYNNKIIEQNFLKRMKEAYRALLDAPVTLTINGEVKTFPGNILNPEDIESARALIKEQLELFYKALDGSSRDHSKFFDEFGAQEKEALARPQVILDAYAKQYFEQLQDDILKIIPVSVDPADFLSDYMEPIIEYAKAEIEKFNGAAFHFVNSQEALKLAYDANRGKEVLSFLKEIRALFQAKEKLMALSHILNDFSTERKQVELKSIADLMPARDSTVWDKFDFRGELIKYYCAVEKTLESYQFDIVEERNLIDEMNLHLIMIAHKLTCYPWTIVITMNDENDRVLQDGEMEIYRNEAAKAVEDAYTDTLKLSDVPPDFAFAQAFQRLLMVDPSERMSVIMLLDPVLKEEMSQRLLSLNDSI